MDDQERLERLEAVLEAISESAEGSLLLVEGDKDVAALKAVGVDGEFFRVQCGGGPVKASEHAWRRGMPAVILTDWDRRGDLVAEGLRSNLRSLGVAFDDSLRSELAFLCRPFCKDVESLDAVLALLRSRVVEGQQP